MHDRHRSICVTTLALGAAPLSKHSLNELNAPARTVELVTKQHIGPGKTSGSAHAAMDASAQFMFGRGEGRIG